MAMRPPILAIYNQKGGAGKSVTAANLAAVLSGPRCRFRVLLLELDRQGNCSLMLGVRPSDFEFPMTRVFEGAALADCVVPLGAEGNLHLVPGDAKLPDVQNSLHSMVRREEVLARQLADELAAYDIVLVDMPPSTDLLAVNGLVLCSQVVVPVRMTDANCVNGVIDLQAFLATLSKNDWPRPILRVLRLDVKRRTDNYRTLNEALVNMDLPLSEIEIPHTTKVEQSVTVGHTVVTRTPDSPPAIGYFDFAHELLSVLAPVRAA